MGLLDLLTLWPPFTSLGSGGDDDVSVGGPPGTYDIGDVVRCFVEFTDPLNDDARLDPTAVYFATRSPRGTVASYQYSVGEDVARAATGVYYLDVELDEAGTWHIRAWSTGTGQAAVEMKLIAQKHWAM